MATPKQGFHRHDPIFHPNHPDHAKRHEDLHSRKEGEDKYGDVKFADPAHGRFPIDTDAHIRAAESYARFASPEVKARIDAAAREHGIGKH